MKKLFFPLSFVLLFLGFPSKGQQKMPDVYIVSSDFEYIDIIRMRSGTDLLEGLNTAVKEKNINAHVLFFVADTA